MDKEKPRETIRRVGIVSVGAGVVGRAFIEATIVAARLREEQRAFPAIEIVEIKDERNLQEELAKVELAARPPILLEAPPILEHDVHVRVKDNHPFYYGVPKSKRKRR